MTKLPVGVAFASRLEEGPIFTLNYSIYYITYELLYARHTHTKIHPCCIDKRNSCVFVFGGFMFQQAGGFTRRSAPFLSLFQVHSSILGDGQDVNILSRMSRE